MEVFNCQNSLGQYDIFKDILIYNVMFYIIQQLIQPTEDMNEITFKVNN